MDDEWMISVTCVHIILLSLDFHQPQIQKADRFMVIASCFHDVSLGPCSTPKLGNLNR